MTSRSWEEIRNCARATEHTLEDKITTYISLIRPKVRQTVISNIEEESVNERKLMLDIENGLSKLSDTIDEMTVVVNKSSIKAQDAILKRYREIYFDLNTKFRRSMSSLQEKRDAQSLFGDRVYSGVPEDAEMNSLLNERRTVDSTRSMTSIVIEQAMATKNALENQRRYFTSSRGKVSTVASSFTGINTLVEQIRRKKMRNNIIIAVVIAGCTCFTLWWVVLSKL
ncbi:putative golgi SNAP receptor complex, subunit 1 [Plasmopara halstedii]